MTSHVQIRRCVTDSPMEVSQVAPCHAARHNFRGCSTLCGSRQADSAQSVALLSGHLDSFRPHPVNLRTSSPSPLHASRCAVQVAPIAGSYADSEAPTNKFVIFAKHVLQTIGYRVVCNKQMAITSEIWPNDSEPVQCSIV